MYIKIIEVYEMITIKDLTVSYQGQLALDKANLNINGPTITGIIGPNGAGKSTLIKGLLGIVDHQGQALLDGQPLDKELKRIAYVEQKINIDYNFPIKVKECVSLGLYPKIKLFQRLKTSDWGKVKQALKIVGLEDFAERQISQLSGGQFQRVLIARCLVKRRNIFSLMNPLLALILSAKKLSWGLCDV